MSRELRLVDILPGGYLFCAKEILEILSSEATEATQLQSQISISERRKLARIITVLIQVNFVVIVNLDHFQITENGMRYLNFRRRLEQRLAEEDLVELEGF